MSRASVLSTLSLATWDRWKVLLLQDHPAGAGRDRQSADGIGMPVRGDLDCHSSRCGGTPAADHPLIRRVPDRRDECRARRQAMEGEHDLGPPRPAVERRGARRCAGPVRGGRRTEGDHACWRWSAADEEVPQSQRRNQSDRSDAEQPPAPNSAFDRQCHASCQSLRVGLPDRRRWRLGSLGIQLQEQCGHHRQVGQFLAARCAVQEVRLDVGSIIGTQCPEEVRTELMSLFTVRCHVKNPISSRECRSARSA